MNRPNDINDQAEFEQDMDYLRGLADAMLEHCGARLRWQNPEPLVMHKVILEMPPTMLTAVFDEWPTFDKMWANA